MNPHKAIQVWIIKKMHISRCLRPDADPKPAKHWDYLILKPRFHYTGQQILRYTWTPHSTQGRETVASPFPVRGRAMKQAFTLSRTTPNSKMEKEAHGRMDLDQGWA